MKRSMIAAALLAVAGCTGRMGTDAGDSAARDGSSDAVVDGATVLDGTMVVDGSGSGDSGGTDVVQPADAADVQGVDTAGMDIVVSPDTGATDVPRPTDSPAADVPITTDGAACTGTLSVTVTAPASGAMIETCTRGGMSIFYDFTATTTGTSVSSVTFNWRNPDGALVSPTTAIRTGPPFVAHRQVGGLDVAGTPTSLAVAGGRNAIGGTWHVEVAAMDACGRTATAMQPFVLAFTRGTSCPNP